VQFVYKKARFWLDFESNAPKIRHFVALKKNEKMILSAVRHASRARATEIRAAFDFIVCRISDSFGRDRQILRSGGACFVGERASSGRL
jgi:hypothetical protein